jgi:hypothetical protein
MVIISNLMYHLFVELSQQMYSNDSLLIYTLAIMLNSYLSKKMQMILYSNFYSILSSLKHSILSTFIIRNTSYCLSNILILLLIFAINLDYYPLNLFIFYSSHSSFIYMMHYFLLIIRNHFLVRIISLLLYLQKIYH